MKTQQASTKKITELRLLTATVYFKAVNEVHDAILQFDPLTPVIPITTGTSVAELYADASEHINNGATRVMIPVLSPSNLTLSVVTLDQEEINALDHTSGQAVHSLLEIHTPKRSWPLSELYSDDNEGLAQVSRCFARLVA
ncbi:hypothetical protein N24_1298 [Corynebacterium suranareeae]|uniref:Uncharacterized protein n=1 Tax=Corynebacterium suranareeae TaxID=2506452 RepID=A0A160PSZ3_9CORY|nr:hypothetical protein [Corynebacterium suranareeae]BAU95560.1 hypothetical protein N24_1298 [Corynebacterium suranareeae]